MPACFVKLSKWSLKAWLAHSSCKEKASDTPKMGWKSKASIARAANFGRTQKQSMPPGSPADVLRSIGERQDNATAAHPQVSSPSKIISIPHHTPSLDTLIALQGSWMCIERDLQARRPFGPTESTMVIEPFCLWQLAPLIVTSNSLQYNVILHNSNSRF